MGCSASLQHTDTKPLLLPPSKKPERNNPNVIVTEPTSIKDPIQSPKRPSLESYDSSNKTLQQKLQKEIHKKTVNQSPRQMHLLPLNSPGLNYASEDDDRSTIANSPKESHLLDFARRYSHGANAQSFTSKPSTFLREKVCSGEESSRVENNTNIPFQLDERQSRRTSLGWHVAFREQDSESPVKNVTLKIPEKPASNSPHYTNLVTKTPGKEKETLREASPTRSKFPSLHRKQRRTITAPETIGSIVMEAVQAEEVSPRRLGKEEIKWFIEKKFTKNLLENLGAANKKPTPMPRKSLRNYKSNTVNVPGENFTSQMKERQAMNFKKLRFVDFDEEGEKQPKSGNQTPTSRKDMFDSVFENASDNGSNQAVSEVFRSPRRRLSQFSAISQISAIPKPVQGQFRHSLFAAPSLLMSENKLYTNDALETSVVETRALDKSVDEEGNKKVNQYILGKDLGRGTFGKVRLGSDNRTGENFAVKIANKHKLKKKMLDRGKNMYSQLETEIAVMKKLKHPNIVELYEVIDDPAADKLYLIMEFVQRGAVMSDQYWAFASPKKRGSGWMRAHTQSPECFKRLVRRGYSIVQSPKVKREDFDEHLRPLNEDRARKYFAHLILGLDYLHNYAKIIHRDIKPENLLIDEHDNLKISDFNISHIMEDTPSKVKLKTAAGTKAFLAPEAWGKTEFRGEPLDIWAAGATLYYFLYGKRPFLSGNLNQLKELILNTEPEFPENSSVSEEAIDLIKRCLKKNPEQRATIAEILRDKWLTDDGSIVLDNPMSSPLVLSEKDLSLALTTKLHATFRIAVGILRSARSARQSVEMKRMSMIRTDTSAPEV